MVDGRSAGFRERGWNGLEGVEGEGGSRPGGQSGEDAAAGVVELGEVEACAGEGLGDVC